MIISADIENSIEKNPVWFHDETTQLFHATLWRKMKQMVLRLKHSSIVIYILQILWENKIVYQDTK